MADLNKLPPGHLDATSYQEVRSDIPESERGLIVYSQGKGARQVSYTPEANKFFRPGFLSLFISFFASLFGIGKAQTTDIRNKFSLLMTPKAEKEAANRDVASEVSAIAAMLYRRPASLPPEEARMIRANLVAQLANNKDYLTIVQRYADWQTPAEAAVWKEAYSEVLAEYLEDPTIVVAEILLKNVERRWSGDKDQIVAAKMQIAKPLTSLFEQIAQNKLKSGGGDAVEQRLSEQILKTLGADLEKALTVGDLRKALEDAVSKAKDPIRETLQEALTTLKELLS